jgi:hypothetical protein
MESYTLHCIHLHTHPKRAGYSNYIEEDTSSSIDLNRYTFAPSFFFFIIKPQVHHNLTRYSNIHFISLALIIEPQANCTLTPGTLTDWIISLFFHHWTSSKRPQSHTRYSDVITFELKIFTFRMTVKIHFSSDIT